MHPSIAIVGAGFSGTMVAVHLLRRTPPQTRITLIERSGAFGPGLAYGADQGAALLNAPVGRMSAFEDQPLDFHAWLQRHLEDTPSADAFVPRHLYGGYLRHALARELRSPGQRRIVLLRDTVSSIEQTFGECVLRLASGATVRADAAVLAIGNPPPTPVAELGTIWNEPELYCGAPWSVDAFDGIRPDQAVLLVGTGLTMVDAATALLDRGHAGPIHAVSRRGLLPRGHTTTPPGAAPELTPLPPGLIALGRHLRHIVRTQAPDVPWQRVIDALRPSTSELWQALSIEERGRFLRHLRPWWEVHRHRMPPALAERIDTARASGQLRIAAARITGCTRACDGVHVHLRPRRGTATSTLPVARVVNCTGPATDVVRIGNPLMRSLLAAGLVRSDPLGLGLDVAASGALRGRYGTISSSLFAIGPLTKGLCWEMTAVPELRRQCERLAAHLAMLGRAPATSTEEPQLAAV